MQQDVVQAHAAQHRERHEAGDQRQRHPVRNRHREQVARGCERHQGRKQQKAGGIEDHEFTRGCS